MKTEGLPSVRGDSGAGPVFQCRKECILRVEFFLGSDYPLTLCGGVWAWGLSDGDSATDRESDAGLMASVSPFKEVAFTPSFLSPG